MLKRPKSFKELRGKLRYENENIIDWRFFLIWALTIIIIGAGFYAKGITLLACVLPNLYLSFYLISKKIFAQKISQQVQFKSKLKLVLIIFTVWFALIIGFFSINRFFLETQINWQILLATSILATIGNLFINIKIEKHSVDFDLWKKNAIWLIPLITYILVNRFGYLDYVVAFICSFFIVIYYLKKINTLLDFELQKNKVQILDMENSKREEVLEEFIEITVLEPQIEQKLLLIPKVTAVHKAEKISFQADEDLIVLKLVVDNHTSQEEIFEAKTQAKKILYQNKLENNVVEIEYEAEYKGLIEN
jgi:Co/Zn/Cd efflux system component